MKAHANARHVTGNAVLNTARRSGAGRWLATLFTATTAALSVGCAPQDDANSNDGIETGATTEELRFTLGLSRAVHALEVRVEESLLRAPCRAARPLFDAGNDMTHLGVFYGAAGQGSVLSVHGWAGAEVVYDLYHQEFAAWSHTGFGVTLPTGASVGASFYAGMAFGLDNGVMDWEGYYGTAGTSISLPFLTDYLSLAPEAFISADDRNGDGLITPNELIAPPDSVYGFSLGINVGVGTSLFTNPLPIDVSIAQGDARPLARGTLDYFNRFRRAGVTAYLADADGGACPQGWPDAPGTSSHACLVRFGDPDSPGTHLSRALTMTRAMCRTTALCATPVGSGFAVLALAIGALHDYEERTGTDAVTAYNRLCPAD